jgi:hypothetical protein
MRVEFRGRHPQLPCFFLGPEHPRSLGSGELLWVVDYGSSHRVQAAVRRLRKAYRKAFLVHALYSRRRRLRSR